MADVLIVILTGALIVLGLAGTLLPSVPGVPLVFAGIALYAWHTSFEVISLPVLGIFLLLTVGAVVLDYVASAIGAKRYGASRTGVYGALIGGVAGTIMLGPVGLLVGPFAGAAIGELLSGRSLSEAGRSGWGSLLGTLGSALGQFVIGVTMVVAFLIAI